MKTILADAKEGFSLKDYEFKEPEVVLPSGFPEGVICQSELEGNDLEDDEFD